MTSCPLSAQILAYLIPQVTSWVLALLEVFAVVGSRAHAALDSSTPLDVTLCVMMYLGTLHKGLISDRRLTFVCRIGFCVDGIIFFVNHAYMFWPMNEAHAHEAANHTADPASAPSPLNVWGIINGFMWFFFWTLFAGTVATNCLAAIRRRLLDGIAPVDRSAFCTRLLMVNCAAVIVQYGLGAWTILNVATASTLSAQIIALKSNRVINHLALILAQAFAMKCAVFDMTGRTVSEFCAGRGTKASYVAVFVMIACLLITIAAVVLCLTASRGDDPQLLAVDLLHQGPYLNSFPFVIFWAAAFFNMGGTIGHLINVDKAEDRLLARRKAQLESAAQGAPPVPQSHTPHPVGPL